MKKILRKRFSAWSLLSAVALLGVTLAAAFALSKPVPEFLVAKEDIRPGQELSISQFTARPIDLGETGALYLTEKDFEEGYVVSDFISRGELLSRRYLSNAQTLGMTTVVLLPALKISPSIAPGSWVQIWRTVEGPEGFVSERVVERSKVVSLSTENSFVYGSGAQVEVAVSQEQSGIILQSISAEQDIFVLVAL